MTIAVHIRFSDDAVDAAKNLHYQCFSILAEKNPGDQFIFIFDNPYPSGLINQKNIKALLLPPQIKNSLLQHYWYNFKIPRLLNKYQVDHFVTSGPICSLRSNIPQSMVINDISFLDKKNLLPAGVNRYLKKYFKKFVAKASSIVVTNQYIRNKLAGLFPEAIDKMQVIGSGLNTNNKTFKAEEIQQLKDNYTNGKEYFLAFITDATIENTIPLLKAFSAFKKRQLSNMHLVLLNTSSQQEDVIKDFTNYKYREEVKILNALTQAQENSLIVAAYAAIYMPSMNIQEESGLLALAHNVPLITVDDELSKSLYHEAALYSPATEQQIAQHMMLLYKDENLRNNLLHAGRSIAAAYSWERVADKLGQSILNTAAQTA